MVTTNFDPLFERAAAELALEPLPHEAPMLPTPSDDQDRSFRGLVYLHGRMGEGGDGHRRLVLTSADLGNAYLIDGYARRFVLRLVGAFTPVFVGYSLADPTLRYLFDAIGAEEANRRRPRSEPAAFIFRPNGADKSLPSVVQVIPYDPRDEDGLLHALLHRTLEAWSTWRRDPKTRLRGILRNAPDGLPPHEIELVNWSVLGHGREPGFGASIFAALNSPASLQLRRPWVGSKYWMTRRRNGAELMPSNSGAGSKPGGKVTSLARPFGFALTDPGRRLSRTRLFPEVTRIGPLVVSRGE